MRILVSALLLASSAAFAQEVKLQGAFTHEEYPLALGDRPLVLPNFMIEGTPQFEFVKVSPSKNTSDLALRVGFGIGNLFQVDAITAFAVDPETDWSKGITGEFRALALDTRDLDVAALVSVPFDFADGHDFFSGATVGLDSRYRITHLIYVFGLRDLAVFHTPNEFSLGLNGTFGVGVDPIPHLSLELQTTLVHLGVTGAIEKTQWFGSDFVPAQAVANYAINRNFDVVAKIGFTDLKNGADAFVFTGGINARL